MYFLAITAILAFLEPMSVHGAVCSEVTSTTCEPTDYTLPSCDSVTKTCGCKTGYLPIRTGCAKRLQTPTVYLPAHRTAEIITGSEGRLECVMSTGSIGLDFRWRLDGTDIPGATSPSYLITTVDQSKVGHYSCVAKYRDPEGSILDSDESDTVKITLVTENAKSNSVPLVIGIPDKAVENVNLIPDCANVPMGASFFLMVDDEHGTSMPFVYPRSALTFNASTQKSIKCVLDNRPGEFFTTIEGLAKTMPTIPSDIDSVALYPIPEDVKYVVNTGSFISLYCITSPENVHMEDNDSSRLEYTFVDSAKMPTTSSIGVYLLTDSKPRTHHVYCLARYDGNEPKRSGNVTVIFSDDYIKNATLIASGSLLLPTSRLVLTCGAYQDGTSYTWYKDGSLMTVDKDRILQIGNFTFADAGRYACWAKRNDFSKMSWVIVRETDVLDPPRIENTDLVDGTKLGADGDFMLVCFTASATAGMMYSWKRNGTDLSNPSRIYMITKASAGKYNGDYICTASFKNQEASSPILKVTIVAAGKVCTNSSAVTECSGEGYKPACDENDRCECNTGYYKKGNGCAKSSAIAAVGSIIFVMAALILCHLL